MTQEELKVLQQMFEAERENTKQMLDSLENRINTKLAEIKEDTEITRTATNSLIAWADEVSVVTPVKFPVKKAK